MTVAEIELLRRSLDKQVEIRCVDGEVMKVVLLLVSVAERDLIYELISTNMQERYSSRSGDEEYRTPFEEIESVQLLE